MLKIGEVNLPGNIVLSPMAGITDAPFREICRRNGADYTISEMITSQVELWDTKKTQQRLTDRWETAPKIIQIAGASPEVIANAAVHCEQIGAQILEINMGCPAKKVCNVLAGSALLRDEVLVKSILIAACKAVKIPVILKTRLGWDHNQKNILTVAKIAEDSGVKSIAIHGRTRSDLYTGAATYDLIAMTKDILKIPVFVNGDIDSPEKAGEVLNYTKADGLYIGRGSLGKPWLFKQIKDYLKTGIYQSASTNYIKNNILTHLRLIHEHYDEYTACRMARKHVKWYCQSLFKDELPWQQFFNKFSKLESYDLQIEDLNKEFEYLFSVFFTDAIII